MTTLTPARDDHFAWLLGEAGAPDGLTMAEGGVEAAEVLAWLRETAAALEVRGVSGSWLIVEAGEVVGLCSCKGPPDPWGGVEIGYGVAASRRCQGHASRALRLAVLRIAASGAVRRIRAETRPDNPASARVLLRNGFMRTGARLDPEDGVVWLWERMLVWII
jgi:RimJ/RimL family protein N-acetyltransferase